MTYHTTVWDGLSKLGVMTSRCVAAGWEVVAVRGLVRVYGVALYSAVSCSDPKRVERSDACGV